MYSPIISHYFISHIAVVHYKPNTFSSMNQGILKFYEIYKGKHSKHFKNHFSAKSWNNKTKVSM